MSSQSRQGKVLRPYSPLYAFTEKDHTGAPVMSMRESTRVTDGFPLGTTRDSSHEGIAPVVRRQTWVYSDGDIGRRGVACFRRTLVVEVGHEFPRSRETEIFLPTIRRVKQRNDQYRKGRGPTMR